LINALVGPLTNAALVVDGSIVSGGNGNRVIDADECNLLGILVQNIGGGTATAVNATLSTTTPGVTITQPGSSYPNIAPNTLATNSPLFQVSTSPSFVCGTPVILTLAVSFAGGSNTLTFALPTCTSCTATQVSAGLSASSPTQTGRLTRNGTVSTCAAAKSCPGYYTTSGSRAYNAYLFTNTGVNAVCVTVTVSTTCSGNGLIFSETYLGSFTPNSLCTDYLADLGSSPSGSAAYSFDVPATTNFTVVVNAVNVGSYCSSYTVTVAGLPCSVDGGGACAGVSANFSGTPTNGVAPLAVTFTDTSTGNITNRFWSFGDGGTTNVTTNSVVYTYNTGGVYTVTLIVTGAGGSSTNTQSNCITVLTPFQAWQIQYFNSTNSPNAAPGADADGTGQNNLFKYAAGLDPTNPASVFLLTIVNDTNQPNAQDLQFLPMVGGRTYTPQFNTDLVNGVWLPLTTYQGVLTNGNQITITDTNALSPQEFYRIEISLP
jgi:PKD repeat protein